MDTLLESVPNLAGTHPCLPRARVRGTRGPGRPGRLRGGTQDAPAEAPAAARTEDAAPAARDVQEEAARPDPLAAVLPSATRYVLVTVHSGKCVDVAGGSLADGGNLQQAACNVNLAQAFDVVEGSSNVYKLLNAHVLDTRGGSTRDASNSAHLAN